MAVVSEESLETDTRFLCGRRELVACGRNDDDGRGAAMMMGVIEKSRVRRKEYGPRRRRKPKPGQGSNDAAYGHSNRNPGYAPL